MPPPEYLGAYRPLLLVDAFSHGAVSRVDRLSPVLPSRPWFEQVTVTIAAVNPTIHGFNGWWAHQNFDPAPGALDSEDTLLYETVASAIQRTAMLGRSTLTLPIRRFSPFPNPRWHMLVVSGPAEAATFQFAYLFFLPIGPGPTDEVRGNARIVAGLVAANQRRPDY
ncbi:MAG: hypothetical protein WAP47_01200 [Candidatus Rokuibacteriota bacterium]